MSALHSAQTTTFTTAYFLSAFIFFTIRGALLFYTLSILLQQQSFFYNNFLFTTPVHRFCFIISSNTAI